MSYHIVQCVRSHTFIEIRDSILECRDHHWYEPHRAICEYSLFDADQKLYPCKHCNRWPHDHAGGLCLFAPTAFEPITVAELSVLMEDWYAAGSDLFMTLNQSAMLHAGVPAKAIPR